MSMWKRPYCIRLSKRPGAALLGTVLVSLIILSIFSAVAFNIAVNAMRVERWQSEHYQDQRLQYLARSGAIALAGAVTKAVSDDGFLFNGTIDKHQEVKMTDTERGLAASVDFIMSADSGAADITLLVKAYDAKDNTRKLQATYNKSSKKVTEWRAVK